jgi:5S rRNA maturation endonuclease (ribonuclease M5)
MDAFVFTPPADLIENYTELKLLIDSDISGEKTRQFIQYLDEASIKSQEMQVQSTDFEEKEFSQMAHESFLASKRIVLAAWKQAHGTDLNSFSYDKFNFGFLN